MFLVQIKKSLKGLVFFSFLGAVVFGSFCMGMLHAHSIHTMEKSSGFSITEEGMNCCGLASVTKANLWQSISVSTFDLRDSLNLMGLALALVLSQHLRVQSRHRTAQKLSSRIRWLIKGNPSSQLFSPLQMAFAAGILNPKTY